MPGEITRMAVCGRTMAVAIAFALRHPNRVSHLVLFGGFAVGRFKRPNNTDADRERFAAMAALMKLGWGGDDPTFRQIFTSQLMPTATRQQADAFNELQRKSASPECAVRYYETVNNFDIRPLLPRVATPTLVIHVRDDVMVPVELGREIAAGIPEPGSLHCRAKIIFFWTAILACRSFSRRLSVF